MWTEGLSAGQRSKAATKERGREEKRKMRKEESLAGEKRTERGKSEGKRRGREGGWLLTRIHGGSWKRRKMAWKDAKKKGCGKEGLVRNEIKMEMWKIEYMSGV